MVYLICKLWSYEFIRVYRIRARDFNFTAIKAHELPLVRQFYRLM